MRPATPRSSFTAAAHLGRLFCATLAALTVALALVIAALRVTAVAVGADDPAEVANLALATTLEQRAPLLAGGLVGLATIWAHRRERREMTLLLRILAPVSLALVPLAGLLAIAALVELARPGRSQPDPRRAGESPWN